MSYRKNAKRMIAGLLAVLLVFQMIISDRKIVVSAGSADTADIEMENRYNYTIKGTVTEKAADGVTEVPVAGVTVTFGEMDKMYVATTDDQGEYTVDVTFEEGISTMPWKAEKTGYAVAEGILEKGTEEHNISLTAFMKDTLNIKVTTKGMPVNGAKVTLTGYNLPIDGSTVTSSNGMASYNDIYANGSYLVKVSMAGCISYRREISEEEIKNAFINKEEIAIELKGFGFEKTGADLKVPWNAGSFENRISAQDGITVKPEYTIIGCVDADGTMIASTDYAQINSDTGIISLKDLSDTANVKLPVTLTIQAVNMAAEAADRPNETASYELEITKPESKLEWKTNIVNKELYYGKRGAYITADAFNLGSGQIKYSLLAGSKFVSIGESDGIISYVSEVNEDIQVTVKAEIKDKGNLYNVTEDTYTFTVKRKVIPATELMLKGYKYKNKVSTEVTEPYRENGGNGWFSSVKVAKENCEFTDDLTAKDWEDKIWKSEISLTKSDCRGKEFYVREADGTISAKMFVSGIKWDDAEPTDFEITYEDPHFSKEVAGVTYGYYKEPVKVTVSAKDSESGIARLELVSISQKDGKREVLQQEGMDKAEFTISREDSFKFEVNAYDNAGNKTTYQDKQNVIVLDKTVPVVGVAYDNTTAVNGKYYNKKRIATIEVVEENFDSSGVEAVISEKDISGKEIADATVLLGNREVKVSELSREIKKAQYWSNSGMKHTLRITYQENAHYTIQIQAADMAGNVSKAVNEDFWLDTGKPYDLKISYKKPLLGKVLEGITFGYYKSSVDVTFTATDVTAGVDTLSWWYTGEKNSSKVNAESAGGTFKSDKITYSDNGRKAVAKVRLTAKKAAQYRGNMAFSVTDKAGNHAAVQDNKNIVVVDNITPTMRVDYTPSNQAGNKVYFDKAAKLNFHVTEANFYKEDVVIKVNGKKVVCNNWKQEKDSDVWKGSLLLKKNGNYKVSVEYKDCSDNQMKKYTSPLLVVDTKKPVIKVDYDNRKAVYSENGNDYFDKMRTATIQITDDNFNAGKVEAVVTATKVDGTTVKTTDYKSYLQKPQNWKKNGNVYTTAITYNTDANYTFDISCTDMAKNESADYKKEYFTIDTTKPENLQITYSDSLLETVLENISFGFYNARVNVTITAEDDVTGINHFVYSYKNAENVSGENGQLLEQKIGKDRITYSNGQKTATAQFTIPKSELDRNNQFNGIVEVDAVDNSNNKVHKADSKRIVVDNIAPAIEVTYNEPVSSANGIDYYAQEISGQIVINEANFRSEDVEISATRDGAPYALSVSWSDADTDVHNGSFQIGEDGDYQITINYKDKSGNTMETYQSNQLTVDSTVPTITVEEIANGTAYNQETIALKILVDDVNFDRSSFQPSLTAVVHEKNGGFATKDYSELGTIQTVEEGKSYAYVIENIPEDAIYTLSCSVKDLSLNEISEMTVAESQNTAMESIMFSVNRNGSTFLLDDNTQKLAEAYYTPIIEHDVVLREVNCDAIEKHEINVNGEKLEENVQYHVEESNGPDTWYQYDYIVDKEVFEEEGDYTVVAVTTDRAENIAYSDMKNTETSFVVDKTAPVVTVSGLTENGRYQVESQTVNVIPTDDGGKLESLAISVYDSEDKLITETVADKGEALSKVLAKGDGKITFDIPQGVNQKVSIRCADAAGNVYENTINNVTVSTEWYVMVFANKAVLYGGIAGVAAVIAAVGGIVFFRIKKKKVKGQQ